MKLIKLEVRRFHREMFNTHGLRDYRSVGLGDPFQATIVVEVEIDGQVYGRSQTVPTEIVDDGKAFDRLTSDLIRDCYIRAADTAVDELKAAAARKLREQSGVLNILVTNGR